MFLDYLATILANQSWLTWFLVILSLLYIYGVWTFQAIRKIGLNGPKPFPFVGNLLQVQGEKFVNFFSDNCRKYGKIWGFYMGRNPSVVISDVELLRQILVKDFPKFMNRLMPGLHNASFKGLLRTRDEEWKRIRSTLTPTFTTSKMKLMVPLINESCQRLVEKMEEIAKMNHGVDVWTMYGRFTMEVILSAAFGVKAETQSNPDDEYTGLAKAIFKPDLPSLILGMCAPFLLRIYSHILPESRLKAASNLTELASQIVEARKTGRINLRNDLLQLMLSAQMVEEDGKKVQKLSNNEIVSQSVTFLLAGYDTTSNALTFTSYLLALHPDIQDKLIKEIDEHFPDDETPDYETVQSIPYLDMVLNEALRLYPPAPAFNRECKESCTVGNVEILKGFTVFIPVHTIHHDPEHWPDPDQFDPERFSPEVKATRHPYAFLPFGAGPRNCIGMRFALLEAKMALVKILKRFKFERSPETQIPIKVKASITLSPQNGAYLKIVARK